MQTTPNLLAAQIDASPERLRDLYSSQGQSTRKGNQVYLRLAKNPNTPPDVLYGLVSAPRILSRSYEEEIAANPVYPLLLLEQHPAALVTQILVRANRLHGRFRKLSMQRRAAAMLLFVWDATAEFLNRNGDHCKLLIWLANNAILPKYCELPKMPYHPLAEAVAHRGRYKLIDSILLLVNPRILLSGLNRGQRAEECVRNASAILAAEEELEAALSFAETYTPREDLGTLYWETYHPEIGVHS